MLSIDLCQLLESRGMISVIKCLNNLSKKNLIKLFWIVKNNTALEYNFKVICDTFFCNMFDDFSSFINLPQKKAVVLGDFNCNLLNVSNNNDCDTFFETFTSSGLPTILFPTRVDPLRFTATVIDNIFVSTSLGNHLSSK